MAVNPLAATFDPLILPSIAPQMPVDPRTPEQIAVDESIERGKALGEEFFAEGSFRKIAERAGAEELGQVTTREQQAAVAGRRSQDIADIVARRRAQLGGFSPEEQQALREQTLGAIGGTEQTALRQLRGVLGAQGVRGGLAAAQQADVITQAQQARTQLERDVFLQQIAERRRALGAFEQTVTGAEAGEFGREQTAQAAFEAISQQVRGETQDKVLFNIQQEQREQFGRLATTFGFAGLDTAERASAAQQALGEKQIEAGISAAEQAGKK